MPYPWASFGGFMFRKEEQPIWGTDVGWNLQPTVARVRPLGTSTDVTTVLSIGSAERSFELWMTIDRYNALKTLMTTRALFTDWLRPVPDSRQAVLMEVTPLADGFGNSVVENSMARKKQVRITLVSA